MPSILLIDGGQGQGKTTLATHIIDFYNQREELPPMDLSIRNHTQLGFGGVDFISKFNRCAKLNYPAIAYDEAGDYSRASTLSFFNYQLSKLFQKIRSGKMIVLLIMPNFNILDNRLFDDESIRGAVHCFGRQNTVNWGNLSVYSVSQLSWIRYWYNKMPTARRHDCYSRVSPIFQSRFKNLPPERARQLEVLSNYGKQSERINAEVKMKGLVTLKDLAREVNRSYIWVKLTLLKRSIKPEQVYGRLNYYHKSTIKVLENIINERR